MAWDFVSILENGASSDGLYPVPTGRGVGIEPLPGEDPPTTFDLYGLSVNLDEGAGSRLIYQSLGNPASLVLTDRRLCVVFKKVPRNRSGISVIALGQQIANAGHHKGESMVGHVLFGEIAAIGARDFAAGFDKKLPALRWVIFDVTQGTSRALAVEATLTGRTKASRIADDLLARVVRHRLADAAFANDEAAHEQWRALLAKPFNPERKNFEIRAISPSHRVTAESRMAEVG